METRERKNSMRVLEPREEKVEREYWHLREKKGVDSMESKVTIILKGNEKLNLFSSSAN